MRFNLENLKTILDYSLADELEHLELCIFEDESGDLVDFDHMDSSEAVKFIEEKYPRHTSHIAYNLLILDMELKRETEKLKMD